MNFNDFFNGMLNLAKRKTATVTITNKTTRTSYQGSQIIINGESVINSIDEEEIVIDGEKFILKGFKDINIQIDANVIGDVKTMSGSLTINGDVDGKASTMSGNLTCSGTTGDVNTMSGNVKVSGDVNGKIKTMSGDIKIK